MRRPWATALAFVLILAACNGEPPDGVMQADDGSPVGADGGTVEADGTGFAFGATAWWRSTRTVGAAADVDLHPTGDAIDRIISRANLGIRATVTAVSEPYWNIASGQAWTADDDVDFAIPLMYREVTLAVEDVLFDEVGHATPGAMLQIVVFGEGAREGTENPGYGAGDGLVLGAGDEIVVFLAFGAFRFREGVEDLYWPVHGEWSVLDWSGGSLYTPRMRLFDEVIPTFRGVEGIDAFARDRSWDLETLRTVSRQLSDLGVVPVFSQTYPESERKELVIAEVGLVDPPPCLNTPKGVCP